MLSLFLCQCLILSTTANTLFYRSHNFLEAWNAYKEEFKKYYASFEEESRRYKIWKSNVQLIKEHNVQADLGHSSYRLAINEFGDITNQEFRDTMLNHQISEESKFDSHATYFLPAMNVHLPATVDWRQQGFVTGVKRQWQCIGSWAFSTTGSLEGQNFRQTGTLLSLSEQQLLDCSQPFGNDGCAAGSVESAFEFVIASGLKTEANYPYTAKTNNCSENTNGTTFRIRGYAKIRKESEDDLLNAVATAGPISVKVDASSFAFQFYKEGVFNETQCSRYELNQNMLLVGYGTLKEQQYWLVKNSWAETWGQDGYILMSRNVSNQCGIATSALFPLV